jgi:hypothetical protein
MYTEAKSVGQWLRHGWHVAVAYVLGFFVLLLTLGWHPSESGHFPPIEAGPVASAPAEAAR